jgi:hypothetical protein
LRNCSPIYGLLQVNEAEKPKVLRKTGKKHAIVAFSISLYYYDRVTPAHAGSREYAREVGQ